MAHDNRIAAICVGFVGLALLAAMIVAMIGRGPWYDEFYTFYVTQPGIGGGALLRHWLADNHPPLFYAVSWATGWLGDTVQMRRFVNLLFLAGGLAALLGLIRARPEWRPLAIPYAIALAGFWPALEWAAELRSNYLVYVASALVVAALAALMVPGERAVTRRDAVLLGGSLMLACNVHLVATLIDGTLAFAFGLRLLAARDWPRARLLVLATVVAVLPLAATMALQFGQIEANTRSFWIPGGFDAARWALENELVAMLGANPVLTLAGTAGLATLAATSWRERRLDPGLALAATIAAGTALAVVLLVAAHMWRPIIIDRYLVALNPPMAMILAIGVVALIRRCRDWVAGLTLVLITAGALAAISAHLRGTLAFPSWYGTARAIAATVQGCPGTLVYADTRWNQPVIDMPPADNRAVVPFAYRWVAGQNGFHLQPPEARAMAQGCPTLFWTEHAASEHPDAAQVAARLRRDGYPIGSARIERIDYGWVLFAEPAAR